MWADGSLVFSHRSGGFKRGLNALAKGHAQHCSHVTKDSTNKFDN